MYISNNDNYMNLQHNALKPLRKVALHVINNCLSSCELRLSIYNCNHMGSLLIKLTKSWISCDHLRN